MKFVRSTRYAISGKSKSSTGNMARHLGKEHGDEVVLNVLQPDENEFVSQRDSQAPRR